MESVMLIIPLVVFAVFIAGVWQVFEKAGEAGWKSLIPIYNAYIGIRISGHSGWWLLVPVLLFVVLAGAWVLGVSMMIGDTASTGATANTLGVLIQMIFVSLQIAWVVISVILYDLSRSFGKGLGFTLGLAVLGFIFWPILGFGDAEYRGPVAHPNTVEQDGDADSKES